MNVLVCYKIVYEEQDIVVSADGNLSFDRAELKLSLYDLNAVEEGARIADATGGSVKALSVGDAVLENSKLRKGILSRGPEELYLVKDDSLKKADTNQTAKSLAAAAEKIGYDLILCGEGSADYYAQQTGVQLGEILGVPVINSVSKITPEGDKVVVERTLEDVVEILEVPLPAVICVTSDINTPRLPGMKEILAAGKKKVTEWSFSDVEITAPEATVEVVSVLAPEQVDRKNIVVEGDDKVAEFYENIKSVIG
ncbi:MAG: electron transfer flavoprotein [Deferribacterales bacterium]